jgi:hypothetical protein
VTKRRERINSRKSWISVCPSTAVTLTKILTKFFIGPVANLAGMLPYEKLNGQHNNAIAYNINCYITGLTRGSLPPPTASTIFDQMLTLANAPSKFKAVDPVTKEEADNTISIAVMWEYWNLKKQSTPAPDATAFRMRVPYPIAPSVIFWTSDEPGAAVEARERLRALRTFAEAQLLPTFGADGSSKDATGYGNAGKCPFSLS